MLETARFNDGQLAEFAQLTKLFVGESMNSTSDIPFIFREAWIFLIAVTCLNGVIWWRRAQSKIKDDPSLEEGYRFLIKRWLIYGNAPWVVMGLGILYGAVPSALHYFNPRNGPFVLAFYATTVLLWVLSFRWIFFQRGAETLLKYPGLLNLPTSSPWVVKAYFLLCLAGGVIGLLWMILGDIKVP